MSHFSPRDSEGGVLEHDKLLELSTAEGQQELYDYCNRPRRNILEVLYDFRFTTPNIPLEYLFDLFPVVKPRAFSIASAHAFNPNRQAINLKSVFSAIMDGGSILQLHVSSSFYVVNVFTRINGEM